MGRARYAHLALAAVLMLALAVPAAAQLQIDHRQQACVDQGAVLFPVGQGDLEPLTQGVEGVVHPWKALLGEAQGVDPAGFGQGRAGLRIGGRPPQ